MRILGQAKFGFFPAHPDAVTHVAQRLQAPTGRWSLCDPCAGCGAAVAQLAALLKCQPGDVFAVELDETRAEAVKAALPGGNVLAPASIYGVGISGASIGLCWTNGPFDHNFGGSRVERDFLERVTPWLMPNGVLVLVCPDHVAASSYHVQPYLRQWYKDISVVPFPENTSQYGEVAIIAIRRKEPLAVYEVGWQDIQAPEGFVYPIPAGNGPSVFKKTEPTETELRRALAASPLKRLLQAPAPRKVASPPLALGSGHVALLLASGYLDGVVRPKGEPGHVVRGTARKQTYIHSCEDTLDANGEVTGTKTIYRERIQLVVRAVDAAGNLKTFADDQEEKDAK